MSAFMESLCSFFRFVGNFFKGMTISLLYMLKAIVLFFVPKRLRFKDISNDIILITGGASGLGRGMAIKFAKRGARVIVWDVNQAGLEETVKMVEELRSKREKVGTCHYYQVDISNRASVYATAERIKQEIGTVTMVINNAGVVTGKRFLECPDDKIIKTFDVNILAHFWILKAFLPGMMEKNHGHIVSVASIAGQIGAYQLTDYCASKFAAVGFEESLRLELNCDGYDGIHSTVVCPYYISTGMFAGIGRSLIPVLKPEYVVNEIVKAVLVNQEVLCLPSIVYFLLAFKYMVPAKSFLWSHRAIGAASTMKNFIGRTDQPPQGKGTQVSPFAEKSATDNHVGIQMTQSDIGITIPDNKDPPRLNR